MKKSILIILALLSLSAFSAEKMICSLNGEFSGGGSNKKIMLDSVKAFVTADETILKSQIDHFELDKAVLNSASIDQLKGFHFQGKLIEKAEVKAIILKE